MASCFDFILNHFDREFRKSIVTLYAFGQTTTEMLVTTNNGYVYHLTAGEGEDKGKYISCSIPELSGIGVQKFASGAYHLFAAEDSAHIMAITDTGLVFSWGNNCFGQLGIGSKTASSRPTLVEDLKGVIDVSCGAFHTLFLTNTGHVYGCGYNHCGQVGDESFNQKLSPVKLKLANIVAIACGYWHSIALNGCGQVYCWGDNGFGQLIHHNNNNKQNYPILSTISFMSEIFVERIVCGREHTLLLSSYGDVYGFGEVGKRLVYEMTAISGKSGEKFADIGSSIYSDLMAMQSVSGLCYYWGYYDQYWTTFLENTPFFSIDHTFAYFSQPNVTFKSVKLSNINTNRDEFDMFDKSFKDHLPPLDLPIDALKNEEIKTDNGKYNTEFEQISGEFKAINLYSDKEYIVKKIAITNKTDCKEIVQLLTEVRNLDVKYFVGLVCYWFEANQDSDDVVKSENCSDLESSAKPEKVWRVLYIQMECMPKTLESFIKDMKERYLEKESNLLNGIGYYIASQLFMEILDFIHCLRRQNPIVIKICDLKVENFYIADACGGNFIKFGNYLADPTKSIGFGGKYDQTNCCDKIDCISKYYSYISLIIRELFNVELNHEPKSPIKQYEIIWTLMTNLLSRKIIDNLLLNQLILNKLYVNENGKYDWELCWSEVMEQNILEENNNQLSQIDQLFRSFILTKSNHKLKYN